MTKDSDIGSYDGSPRHWKNLHWTRQIRFIAYNKLRTAIRNGIIPPITADTKCADCGGRAEAYEHRNYFKPLEVDPVCNACNINRGEGYPEPEGPAIDFNGIEGKGYAALFKDGATNKESRGMDSSSAGGNSSGLIGNIYQEWTEFPLHLKAAFAELQFLTNNLKGNQLSRGDLRSEYFKEHDPYYFSE